MGVCPGGTVNAGRVVQERARPIEDLGVLAALGLGTWKEALTQPGCPWASQGGALPKGGRGPWACSTPLAGFPGPLIPLLNGPPRWSQRIGADPL